MARSQKRSHRGCLSGNLSQQVPEQLRQPVRPEWLLEEGVDFTSQFCMCGEPADHDDGYSGMLRMGTNEPDELGAIQTRHSQVGHDGIDAFGFQDLDRLFPARCHSGHMTFVLKHFGDDTRRVGVIFD